MPASTHPAVATLQSFFAAMRDWESEAACLFRRVESGEITDEQAFDALKAAHRTKLVLIFQRFVDTGTGATRLKDAGFSFSTEPSYDPAFEEIVSFSGGDAERVRVETRQLRGMRLLLRYEVRRVAGEWKVMDNRTGRFEFQPNWRRTPL